MDSIDVSLAARLAAAGRTSYADLAAEVGLSAPSATERVKKLEAGGVIREYAAVLDPAAFGSDLAAFVWVSLEHPRFRDRFIEGVSGFSQVLECHHVAGDDDYLLKVVCAGTRGLEDLVSAGIKGIEGVTRTRTTVVLSSPVERSFVPVVPA